jgi:glycosyltransferase involved in cell wall biosynthesis
MARVSIILPTCDRPALLPRAVASVLVQTEKDFELLIVDNNRSKSPLAGQPAVVAWLADPRVSLLRVAGARNAAMARNAGLAVAQGEYVAYLDDDDAYRPEKLSRQIALARATAAPVVLCGAAYHLRGRVRPVQCDAASWSGDALVLQARWGTPFLLHRHPGPLRFDETLDAAEDVEFAHRLLIALDVASVPVAAEPLVDVYPQPDLRVNTAARPQWRAAARILALRRQSLSRTARRRYVLRTLLAQAKLACQPGRCAALGARLWRESGGADWRICANALAVSLGWFPGRWVS